MKYAILIITLIFAGCSPCIKQETFGQRYKAKQAEYDDTIRLLHEIYKKNQAYRQFVLMEGIEL